MGDVEVLAEEHPTIVPPQVSVDPMAGLVLVRCGTTELGVVMAQSTLRTAGSTRYTGRQAASRRC